MAAKGQLDGSERIDGRRDGRTERLFAVLLALAVMATASLACKVSVAMDPQGLANTANAASGTESPGVSGTMTVTTTVTVPSTKQPVYEASP
jgi:hypothetical protein